MSKQELPTRPFLSNTDRIVLVCAGLVLIALLITSRFLDPSPEGLGTHQQLGLPSCSFLTMTGLPCPSCGMTTSWSYYTRGDLVNAVQVNSGGLLLAVIATFAGPWMAVSGMRGRWLFGPLNSKVAVVLAIIVPSVIFVHWMIRLYG